MEKENHTSNIANVVLSRFWLIQRREEIRDCGA